MTGKEVGTVRGSLARKETTRSSLLSRLCLLALLSVGWPAPLVAAPAIWAVREWERLPFQGDPERTGLDHLTCVFYSFPARVLALAYEQTVDPAQDDAPVYKGYGDRFMRFLSLARWGWSFETFFYPEITLTGPDGRSSRLTPGVLRELNLLEAEGRRVMADFVWPLRSGSAEIGYLVLRSVIHAEEPTWLYARTFVAGDPGLALGNLTLGSFGGMAGTPPPGQEQWLANLDGDAPAPARGPLPLDPNWFLAAHKLGWSAFADARGSASIVLPEQLQALNYRGGGSITLVPLPGTRALSFALSDFLGDASEQIARLRQEAPQRQSRLRALDWRPDLLAHLALLDREAEALACLADPAHPLRQRWQQVRTRAEEAIRQAAGREAGAAEELAAASCLQEARLLLHGLWPDVVSAYLEQESKQP